MAHILKVSTRTTVFGTEVWALDKTGAYNVDSNVGGWGAPNPELAQSAILCLIKHVSVDGSFYLLPKSPQVVHNPAAVNSAENVFGFEYYKDGHHEVTLIRLPVSNDGGATNLAGEVIDEGAYFAIGAVLYQKTASGNELLEVADYPAILEDEDIVSGSCDKMFYNKLMIAGRDYYKQYVNLRGNAYEDAREILFKHDDLMADIAGADYTFRAGLKLEAENIVKTLLDKHSV